jgi:hypothetical protein
MQLAQPVLDLVHGGVQCGVEIACTRFSSNGRALAHSGDFDTLAALGLPAVGLVEELHVVTDDFLVVAL